MQSADDVDFYVDFPHFLWFFKHVGAVGLLTGWKHLRWRGCHTIWYFQHGGGSVNLTCRFITCITWIRIDHVTHFLMWGNSSTSECSDGRMQGQGGLRCQGKGLGITKSPETLLMPHLRWGIISSLRGSWCWFSFPWRLGNAKCLPKCLDVLVVYIFFP